MLAVGQAKLSSLPEIMVKGKAGPIHPYCYSSPELFLLETHDEKADSGVVRSVCRQSFDSLLYFLAGPRWASRNRHQIVVE